MRPFRLNQNGQILICALVLIAGCAALAVLSRLPSVDAILGPLTASILIVASMAWLALPTMIRANPVQTLVPLLLTGMAMRLVFFVSDPILELDYLRYLWDGAAIGAGLNPYATAPTEVVIGLAGPDWDALAASSGGIAERVTYGHLTTIYPPVAQLGFLVAHWIDPWGLTGLRLVLLLAEVTTLTLIVALLDAVGRPRAWLGIYWCCPLVAKEMTNAAHMDALLLPLLLASLLAAMRARPVWAAAALALAGAVKVWPLVLGPLVLSNARWRDRVAGACVLVGLTAALFLPVALAKFDGGSGLVAYAAGWERNAALFWALEWGAGLLADYAGLTRVDHGRLARLAVAAIVSTVAILLAIRSRPEQIPRSMLIVAATLFLLSPTGYPWYYVWFLPLLCIVPSRGLLLLGALLPLYYLRFWMVDLGIVAVFDRWVVWLEFGPVLLLLAWDAIQRRAA
ncbi:MAG: glycosyltransferase 87 family protein [Pseudomonadota bacterium]